MEVFELLKKTLKPEFINRIDEVIMFNPLSQSNIKDIVRIQLNELSKLLAQNDITIEVKDEAIEWLAKEGFDPQYGARPLKRLIQKELVNELSKKIIAGEVRNDQTILIDVIDGVIFFRNNGIKKESETTEKKKKQAEDKARLN
jgi:ATP-dependent Clp protease ATP-binding subunit ClpB